MSEEVLRVEDLSQYVQDQIAAHCYEEEWFQKRKNTISQGQTDSHKFPLLLKQTLSEAESAGKPIRGCPCYVHIIAWYLEDDEVYSKVEAIKRSIEDRSDKVDLRDLIPHDNSRIFYTTRATFNGYNIGGNDQAVRLPLLLQPPERSYLDKPDPTHECWSNYTHEDADWHPVGFHAAVSSMGQRERAVILCHPLLGYGLETDEYCEKVPESAFLLYDIELTDWSHSLPPVPSRFEAANREVKELKKHDVNETWSERLQKAAALKEMGNQSFKKADFENAKSSYDKAFATLFIDDESPPLTKEERASLNELRTILHANRCLTNMKRDDIQGAIWDINQAIKADPTNRKYLFRKASVRQQRISRTLKYRKSQFFDIEALLEEVQRAKAEFLQSLNYLVKDGNAHLPEITEELVTPPSFQRFTPKPLRADCQLELPMHEEFIRTTTLVSLLKHMQHSNSLSQPGCTALRELADSEQQILNLLRDYWKQQHKMYRKSMKALQADDKSTADGAAAESSEDIIEELPELESIEQ